FVLYGTLWILMVAFVTISLPSAYQQLQATFRTIHPELEDASRILGATRMRSLWEITAPLMRTGLIATWCFVFVGVMRELSAAIILFTSQTKVISVLIYDLNESGDLGAIAVIGIAMLIITFTVVILVNRIPGFGVTQSRMRTLESSDGRETSHDRRRGNPGCAHCRALAERSAGSFEAQMRGPAGRRRRALRHGAPRGLCGGRARRLGR